MSIKEIDVDNHLFVVYSEFRQNSCKQGECLIGYEIKNSIFKNSEYIGKHILLENHTYNKHIELVIVGINKGRRPTLCSAHDLLAINAEVDGDTVKIKVID